jgi:hypothetical protein
MLALGCEPCVLPVTQLSRKGREFWTSHELDFGKDLLEGGILETIWPRLVEVDSLPQFICMTLYKSYRLAKLGTVGWYSFAQKKLWPGEAADLSL